MELVSTPAAKLLMYCSLLMALVISIQDVMRPQNGIPASLRLRM